MKRKILDCLIRWSGKSLLLFLLHFSFSSYTVLPISGLADIHVEISHLPGTYPSPISLTCKNSAELSFALSTDGSFPTKGTSKWISPLVIDTVKSVVLSLYRNDHFTDTFFVGTYLVGFVSSLPVSSIVIPRGDLFDSVSGIYVGGMRADGTTFGNCWKNIEKRANYEFFDNGVQVVSQYCGLKIFGGMTRHNREKSLRVIARKKYGKGKFKYNFFPTKSISSFNSLVLRTSGNDLNGTRFLDVMISSIAKDLGIDYMAYRPAILFVNGEYWGIHNIREKINEDYLFTNHGADETVTDILQGDGYAENGTSKRYEELIDFVKMANTDSPDFIDSVSKRMDIDNYFKYSILQTHIVNPDSRGNIRFWRSGNLDDKFRWIYYDGDLSFANFNTDFLSKKLSPVETDWYNPQWSTVLLRRLLSNKTLKERFINDYCFLLSTLFRKDSLQSRIKSFQNLISPEIDRHLKRRNFNQSRNNWQSHVDRLLNFASQRETTALQHLQQNFQLSEPFEFKINGTIEDMDHLGIYLNNNAIKTLPFSGKFFPEAPFTVSVNSVHPLKKFEKWSDGITTPVRTIKGDPGGMVNIYPVFRKATNSVYNGKIATKIMGFGKWEKLSFILFDATLNKNERCHIKIFDEHYSIILDTELSAGSTIICNDTALFRTEFPENDYRVIEIPSFKLSHSAGKNFYLLDEKGDIIEAIESGNGFSDAPYIVKSVGTFVATAAKPKLKEVSENYFTVYRQEAIIALALLVIALLVFFIFRYRRKKVLLSLIILLFSCVAFSQTQTLKKRKLDPSVLIKSGFVETKRPVSVDCKDFICNYTPTNKLLDWVQPLEPLSVIAIQRLKSYTLNFYKEVANLTVFHPRLKTQNDSVFILLQGIRKKYYLLDSLTGEYLLEVEHQNSLRSWYYPVCLSKDNNQEFSSDFAGLSPNGHFWQLRFKNTSLDPTAVLTAQGYFDPKGIFIESQNVAQISSVQRHAEFIKNFRKEVVIQGLKTNFSQDLESEMKKD